MSGNSTMNVVLAGVGGQGILLASEIVARAALAAGFAVKTNEVHGMAQRGGSVLAQIRYGSVVHSPLVEQGAARCSARWSASNRSAAPISWRPMAWRWSRVKWCCPSPCPAARRSIRRTPRPASGRRFRA